ncbi:histone-lysine N-methyltransferase, H3 lysine-79 specific-like [Impatiens glandulifera]|uniref:histone-lysine N-methyltransferase, H3 lysine-79 specific-like n=1 Tax=Impatiens glandulifera TaxID=253017 RepID=UPI001FB1181D|nr:histone-lysine N-methyltransferase, H3 lysine-79 specific-like [Impatiens glandulifera]XP_047316390.1 histone-lysine N-methyltransferase, H3 lysine-79 specific-like [Impatiens glandulifera]
MNLATKEIDRKTVRSLPANYVSLVQLQEKWMNKQKQKQREKEEQEELILKQREKEEQEELILKQKVEEQKRNQEVEERNRKQDEEQMKKRLGKDVKASENRYNRAKKDRRRNIPSSHHWNQGNVSGTAFRVVRPPHPETDFKFASSLVEDVGLKLGQPNQRKGKEIYTAHRWNENPILEDCRKGNIKQSPAEGKVDKTIDTFQNGREGVKRGIGGNSNARNANNLEPVLEQLTMAVKEDLKISPNPVGNDELAFSHPNQRKGKEIYRENRRNGNPRLENCSKGNKKMFQGEYKDDKTIASVAPQTFENGSESEHEIGRNSNVRNVDMEVKEVLKISTSKIGHSKMWKEKKIYTQKHKNGNLISDDEHNGNQKQSRTEGQAEKMIASVAPETFEIEREGVAREVGRNYNVGIVVDPPPPKAIPQRFQNLSLKGNGSRFFNRSKHEEPKGSKLVWVRKEDISSKR